MAKVIAGMTMSVDGFIADRHGEPAGLYPDLAALQGTEYMTALIRETGAVVMGRGSFAMPDDPDQLADAYEFQVPIFVVTHRPPVRKPRENGRISFTFVTSGGPLAAVEQAEAAAGDRAVTIVGGPVLTTELLVAGAVDELHVDVMPVFLGAGKRFFDDPALADVRLEKLGVVEVGDRTSLRFRVAH
jgi:dihydrofolate reductase